MYNQQYIEYSDTEIPSKFLYHDDNATTENWKKTFRKGNTRLQKKDKILNTFLL